MKKTYIVNYTKRIRGFYRDYTKKVVTDDIVNYVLNKMKLSLRFAGSSGGTKGLFLEATEIEESDKENYKYRSVKNGEYWFNDRDKAEIFQTQSDALTKYYGMVK